MKTQENADFQTIMAKFNSMISGNKLLLDFMTDVRCNGITEIIDDDPAQTVHYAAYLPYSIDEKTFTNAVEYRAGSLGSIEDITEFKIHESYHGLQLSKSAALHAYYNPLSPISFSPASTIALILLMELDAYAKTSWLLSEIPATDSFVPPDRLAYKLKSVFKNAASVEENLLSVATQSRQHIRKAISPDIDMFEAHYAKGVINCFTGNPHVDYGRRIICRLDTEDIYEIGSAFGPNLFAGIGGSSPGTVPEPLLRLSAPTKKLLDDVTRQLGIDEKRLPTMRETLSNWGLRKQSFIDKCRTNRLYGEPAP